MLQILENDGDCDEPRFSTGSLSCLFPIIPRNDVPRKSLSYDKLHQQPLRLGVLKLDGSSFEIEVGKSGTVRELKKAVESTFRHLPNEGTGKVSWEHVWGQFCLCHEGQKLVTDSDYISLIGIKDGDQLHFVRHASTAYNLVKIQSQRENPDSEDESGFSGGPKHKIEKNADHWVEIVDDSQEDTGWSDDDAFPNCKYKLHSLLRCWFPYDKLPKSRSKIEDERSSPLRMSPTSKPGNFKSCLLISSSKHESRRETFKRKYRYRCICGCRSGIACCFIFIGFLVIGFEGLSSFIIGSTFGFPPDFLHYRWCALHA
ncbi:ubiquitin-like superfamily protein [Striga asiatica]|uniref:Ubiquitin-like superfamily protein n=1 Tax=Striga asiatica TaxID=4170 RepID=A0A5A7PRE8_STRAF|nr:ubiquitin-like superfamily protein [Striga asiatica]